MRVPIQRPAYRGRFAPSPTGALHPGSLLAALGSWLLARQAGGHWLLRIEDIDPLREVAGAAALQIETLARFGLQHDGGIVSQSERGRLYRAALDRLLASELAFECHCSRAELSATGGIHRRCVATSRRPDPSIRLRVQDDCNVDFDDLVHGRVQQRVDCEVGDFVLLRADGLWAYQLAVVVDDAAQAITDVVRGGDLIDSTPRQILLQRALDLPTPNYAHLPLLLDPDGRKLSKSDHPFPIDANKPLPILHGLWRCLGQPPLAASATRTAGEFLDAAVRVFQPGLIPRQPMTASAAVHNTTATSHA